MSAMSVKYVLARVTIFFSITKDSTLIMMTPEVTRLRMRQN